MPVCFLGSCPSLLGSKLGALDNCTCTHAGLAWQGHGSAWQGHGSCCAMGMCCRSLCQHMHSTVLTAQSSCSPPMTRRRLHPATQPRPPRPWLKPPPAGIHKLPPVSGGQASHRLAAPCPSRALPQPTPPNPTPTQPTRRRRGPGHHPGPGVERRSGAPGALTWVVAEVRS